MANSIQARDFIPLEALVAAALLYWILCLFSRIVGASDSNEWQTSAVGFPDDREVRSDPRSLRTEQTLWRAAGP